MRDDADKTLDADDDDAALDAEAAAVSGAAPALAALALATALGMAPAAEAAPTPPTGAAVELRPEPNDDDDLDDAPDATTAEAEARGWTVRRVSLDDLDAGCLEGWFDVFIARGGVTCLRVICGGGKTRALARHVEELHHARPFTPIICAFKNRVAAEAFARALNRVECLERARGPEHGCPDTLRAMQAQAPMLGTAVCRACPLRAGCDVLRSKRAAAEIYRGAGGLVITTHALLWAAAEGAGGLPDGALVYIDESVEDVALSTHTLHPDDLARIIDVRDDDDADDDARAELRARVVDAIAEACALLAAPVEEGGSAYSAFDRAGIEHLLLARDIDPGAVCIREPAVGLYETLARDITRDADTRARLGVDDPIACALALPPLVAWQALARAWDRAPFAGCTLTREGVSVIDPRPLRGVERVAALTHLDATAEAAAARSTWGPSAHLEHFAVDRWRGSHLTLVVRHGLSAQTRCTPEAWSTFWGVKRILAALGHPPDKVLFVGRKRWHDAAEAIGAARRGEIEGVEPPPPPAAWTPDTRPAYPDDATRGGGWGRGLEILRAAGVRDTYHGSDVARGSNAFEGCTALVSSEYVVPRASIAQRAEGFQALAAARGFDLDDDDARAAAEWGVSLAGQIQAMHRTRPVRDAGRSVAVVFMADNADARDVAAIAHATGLLAGDLVELHPALVRGLAWGEWTPQGRDAAGAFLVEHRGDFGLRGETLGDVVMCASRVFSGEGCTLDIFNTEAPYRCRSLGGFAGTLLGASVSNMRGLLYPHDAPLKGSYLGRGDYRPGFDPTTPAREGGPTPQRVRIYPSCPGRPSEIVVRSDAPLPSPERIAEWMQRAYAPRSTPTPLAFTLDPPHVTPRRWHRLAASPPAVALGTSEATRDTPAPPAGRPGPPERVASPRPAPSPSPDVQPPSRPIPSRAAPPAALDAPPRLAPPASAVEAVAGVVEVVVGAEAAAGVVVEPSASEGVVVGAEASAEGVEGVVGAEASAEGVVLAEAAEVVEASAAEAAAACVEGVVLAEAVAAGVGVVVEGVEVVVGAEAAAGVVEPSASERVVGTEAAAGERARRCAEAREVCAVLACAAQSYHRAPLALPSPPASSEVWAIQAPRDALAQLDDDAEAARFAALVLSDTPPDNGDLAPRFGSLLDVLTMWAALERWRSGAPVLAARAAEASAAEAAAACAEGVVLAEAAEGVGVVEVVVGAEASAEGVEGVVVAPSRPLGATTPTPRTTATTTPPTTSTPPAPVAQAPPQPAAAEAATGLHGGCTRAPAPRPRARPPAPPPVRPAARDPLGGRSAVDFALYLLDPRPIPSPPTPARAPVVAPPRRALARWTPPELDGEGVEEVVYAYAAAPLPELRAALDHARDVLARVELRDAPHAASDLYTLAMLAEWRRTRPGPTQRSALWDCHTTAMQAVYRAAPRGLDVRDWPDLPPRLEHFAHAALAATGAPAPAARPFDADGDLAAFTFDPWDDPALVARASALARRAGHDRPTRRDMSAASGLPLFMVPPSTAPPSKDDDDAEVAPVVVLADVRAALAQALAPLAPAAAALGALALDLGAWAARLDVPRRVAAALDAQRLALPPLTLLRPPNPH